MENFYYDNFSATRDALYLAGILFGFTAGIFLSLCKRPLRHSQKENRITAGLCVLSAAIMAAALALVLSGGFVIYDGAMLIAACCAVAAGLLAALLPEIFLFPVVIIGGFAVVLAACFFLRYPPADGGRPAASPVLYSDGSLYIGPESPKLIPFAGFKTPASNDGDAAIEYTAAVVTAGRLVPFFGGQQRRIIMSVRLADSQSRRAELYRSSSLEDAFVGFLLSHDSPLINVRIVSGFSTGKPKLPPAGQNARLKPFKSFIMYLYV
jgi:hypothetical protein